MVIDQIQVVRSIGRTQYKYWWRISATNSESAFTVDGDSVTESEAYAAAFFESWLLQLEG